MLSNEQIEEIAQRLRNAEQNKQPIEPVRIAFEPDDVASAYAVQKANVERSLREGRRIVGRKIGFTDFRVQRLSEYEPPDFGTLFADMCYGDNETIPYSELIQPKIEVEIALILKDDLPYEDSSFLDVLKAVGWVAPAFEIVSSRIQSWDLKCLDSIADNGSVGFFVLGGPIRLVESVDLREARLRWSRNGEPLPGGKGTESMGNPVNAAVWLARTMSRLKEPLRAGDIILTGRLGPTADIFAGDVFDAVIEGIGHVSTCFSAEVNQEPVVRDEL